MSRYKNVVRKRYSKCKVTKPAARANENGLLLEAVLFLNSVYKENTCKIERSRNLQKGPPCFI